MTRGVVLNIKHFEIHDGDGLRTTLFLKGCPLRCAWCHNPESLQPRPQLAFYSGKCVSCGLCAAACPNGAHAFEEGRHVFRRERCVGCGKCENACPQNALKAFGRSVAAEDLLEELTADKKFYEATGGGVTVSGGEPLMQADFCAELLSLLKERGIDTAVDTSLYAPRAAIDKVAPFADVFLADVKAFDGTLHAACTGRDNALILENLAYLDGAGKRIEVRVPLIPTVNDGEMEKIACLLCGLKHLSGVKVLSYHRLALAKYEALGLDYRLPAVREPTAEERSRAVSAFLDAGLPVLSE